MAAIDTSRPVAALSAAGFTSVFTNAIGVFAAWNDARLTHKALTSLSARELDDIGLTYGDIDSVSHRITR